MMPRSDTRSVVVGLRDMTAVVYLAGHVDWTYKYRGQTVRVQADRIVVHVKLREEKVPPGDGARRPGAAPKETARDGEKLAVEDFRFYAEGNVRVEVPARRTFLEADSLYYEHATGRAAARGVRLKTTFENANALRNVFEEDAFGPGPYPRETDEDGLGRSPLSLHADFLTMTGFERFRGEGIEVSTCDFAVPHFALSAPTVDVYPVEEPARRRAAGQPPPPGPASRSRAEGAAAEPGFESLGENDFIIDPESTTLEAFGQGLIPLPISYWDTRWQGNLPIRSVDIGASNQFGPFVGVEWNLNYLLSLIPPSRFIPIDLAAGQSSRIGFETAEFSKRGFAYGPVAEYGTRPGRWKPWQLEEWTHYGEAQYFHVDDHGPKDFSTDLPVPRDERYWGHVWHRQSVPYVGLFELEYSKLSDSAFLGEYFEEVAKEEKEQETLAYWQRNIGDNLALTGLYQVRVNDFQSQTERLPEGKLFLLQEQIVLPSVVTPPMATERTGLETGLYTDLGLQAAYLNRLEDDALGIPPRSLGRFDVINEWAYPFGFAPYIQARPFAFARLTDYGEVLDPAEGSEDRATFGAGVSVSQEWSRIYSFDQGSLARTLFGAPRLKHVFVPRITYTNVFSNDLESAELIQIDRTDTVDLRESVAFSIRNAFITRTPSPRPPPSATGKVKPLLGRSEDLLEWIPFENRALLDSEVSFEVFPQPDRDNTGDVSSLLVLDNTVSVIRSLALRAWFELDPNRDFHNERSDVSLGWTAVPGKLAFTVGDRYTRDFSNYAYALVDWRMTEKWHVQAYYARDVQDHRDAEYSLALSRLFHRFVLSFEYRWDLLEDRNMSFHVNFMPLELFKPSRRGTRSTW
jgi:hypothetical protein